MVNLPYQDNLINFRFMWISCLWKWLDFGCGRGIYSKEENSIVLYYAWCIDAVHTYLNCLISGYQEKTIHFH